MNSRIIFKRLFILGALAAVFANSFPLHAEQKAQPETSEVNAFQKQTEAIIRFLKSNTLDDGLPLSYRAPKGYWQSIGSQPNKVEDIIERLLVGEEGFNKAGAVNIYDAAVWQIVMAKTDHRKQADRWTQRLLSGSSGALRSIRASPQNFFFNLKKHN